MTDASCHVLSLKQTWRLVGESSRRGDLWWWWRDDINGKRKKVWQLELIWSACIQCVNIACVVEDRAWRSWEQTKKKNAVIWMGNLTIEWFMRFIGDRKIRDVVRGRRYASRSDRFHWIDLVMFSCPGTWQEIYEKKNYFNFQRLQNVHISIITDIDPIPPRIIP